MTVPSICQTYVAERCCDSTRHLAVSLGKAVIGAIEWRRTQNALSPAPPGVGSRRSRLDLQNINDLRRSTNVAKQQHIDPADAIKPRRRRAAPSEYLTLNEMAEYLRISWYLAQRMVASGQVTAIRCGKLWRVSRESIDKLAGK